MILEVQAAVPVPVPIVSEQNLMQITKVVQVSLVVLVLKKQEVMEETKDQEAVEGMEKDHEG